MKTGEIYILTAGEYSDFGVLAPIVALRDFEFDVVFAERVLDMTATQLAHAIGVHESVLSRAMNGALPPAYRDAIQKLLRERRDAPPRTK